MCKGLSIYLADIIDQYVATHIYIKIIMKSKLSLKIVLKIMWMESIVYEITWAENVAQITHPYRSL